MHQILCIIPARSGSKGLPNKNIKLFKGHPLFTWSIKQAKQSKYIKHMRIPWYFLCMPLFYVFLVYYSKIQKKVISFLYISLSIFILLILLRITLIIYTQFYQFDLLETKQFIDRYSSIEEIVGFIYSLFIFIHKPRAWRLFR